MLFRLRRRFPKTFLFGISFLAVIVSGLWMLSVRPHRLQPVATSNPVDVPPRVMSKPAPPERGYVGSQICAECHESISGHFHGTPMGRSLAAIGDESLQQDVSHRHGSFERGPWTYSVEQTAAGVWHHEVLSDQEGPIYDQAEQIQYAMGSNSRGQSYLLWRDGLMFVSPIAWYTESGWDLSPGYKVGRHQRFSRRVTEACLVCHCGTYETRPDRHDNFPLPVFFEAAIGCERCHGPGKKHVEYRRQAVPSGVDPLLKLDNLAPQERDAVCYQCHFQGDDRFLRYGRNEADFRPGMKVSDVWAIVVKTLGDDSETIAAVAQPTQMESSRCYLASDGKLGCVSCHDPHEVPRPEQRRDYYQQRCLACHSVDSCSLPKDRQRSAPAEGSCVHCHMPKSQAKNVPHAALTDHRVPRRPMLGNNPDGPMRIYDRDGAAVSQEEQERARGFLLVRRGIPLRQRELLTEGMKILKPLVAVMPDDEELFYQLGMAAAAVGQTQDAMDAWRKAIELFPAHESALLQLADAEHDAGNYFQAEEYYARFNHINPRQAIAHGRWAHTLGRLNRLEEAIHEGENALKLDPSMWPMCFWLSEAYGMKGEREKSQELKRRGERISKLMQALK